MADPPPPDATMEDPPLDPSSMSYRELQKACKAVGLPARAKTEELRKNLVDYIQNTSETLKRLGKKIKTKDAWVSWKTHPAREIFNEDIEHKGWLYGKEDEDARDVYDIYRQKEKEAFREVPFDQFEEAFNRTMKKASKRRARSAQEEEWMKDDRMLHPRQSHNHRGEPVFDMDEEAKQQLREDIENRVHKGKNPYELHALRPVYQKYKLDKFRPRIYQEIRRVKFVNYLNHKRTEKRREYAQKKAQKKAAEEVTYVRNKKKAADKKKAAASKVADKKKAASKRKDRN
jgi:hypothetical protein